MFQSYVRTKLKKHKNIFYNNSYFQVGPKGFLQKLIPSSKISNRQNSAKTTMNVFIPHQNYYFGSGLEIGNSRVAFKRESQLRYFM